MHIGELVAIMTTCMIAAYQDAPPKEEGDFRPSELVELVKLEPEFRLDVRYATDKNFTGKPVYDEARAFLQQPAAEALVRVHRKAKEHGYGILVFDGYRPWQVTKFFWTTYPNDRAYLADPAKGSRHNRGCAVDLSFYDLKTGREVEMPSGYDEFTKRAHPDYDGGTPDQTKARELLRKLMESEGFTVNVNEWWHFDYKDWKKYKIQNIPFSEIADRAASSDVKKAPK
jgi:D-alanyl-D-alanine dipeptidase